MGGASESKREGAPRNTFLNGSQEKVITHLDRHLGPAVGCPWSLHARGANCRWLRQGCIHLATKRGTWLLLFWSRPTSRGVNPSGPSSCLCYRCPCCPLRLS